MLERFIQLLHTDDAGSETLAETRERLKGSFALGATRRMTQLGMVVGSAINKLEPLATDTLVYASTFAESRSLESYLDSFPTASPTLFQTSIHPSGAQQALIGRQRSLGEVFSHSGVEQMPAQALLTAMLAPAARVILCGGEERGTWLVDFQSAQDRTFGYALALTRESGPAPLGRLALLSSEETSRLTPAAWFDLLHQRRALDGPIALGWRLQLNWS
ncbi:MAG: hypothetical protein IPP19_08280 [Verrucomicrobia bacterium]|nr:hypothetical protein [Verrucomicrobiota bacterium]